MKRVFDREGDMSELIKTEGSSQDQVPTPVVCGRDSDCLLVLVVTCCKKLHDYWGCSLDRQACISHTSRKER